jgi:hypothetical protein
MCGYQNTNKHSCLLIKILTKMNVNVIVIKTFNKYPSQTKNTSKMLLKFKNLTNTFIYMIIKILVNIFVY